MITEILNSLISKWNDENKCNKCWVLVRTFNDHLRGVTNLYKPTEENKCCTHVFLEYLEIKTNKTETLTGHWKVNYCDYIIKLKIGEQADFSLPKGDETNQLDNIYDKHVESIEECISCSFEDDVCDLIDGTVGIFNETRKPYFSKGDINWSGLEYSLTIRVYN